MIQIRSSSFQNFPHAHIMHCTDNVMHHLFYPESLMFYRVSLDIMLTSDINQSSFFCVVWLSERERSGKNLGTLV